MLGVSEIVLHKNAPTWCDFIFISILVYIITTTEEFFGKVWVLIGGTVPPVSAVIQSMPRTGINESLHL